MSAQKPNNSAGRPIVVGQVLDNMDLPGGKVSTLTDSQIRLLQKARTIAEGDPFEQNLGFTTPILVQANLPHSNPGNERRMWGRHNGTFSLTIQPRAYFTARGEERIIGYPYGSMPRLIMIYLCSEAVRTQSPHIELGASLADFLHKAGIGEATGGRWGTVTRFKDQLHRLLTCHITFRLDTEIDGKAITLDKNASMARETCLWWDPKNPEQTSLFDNYIRLNKDFYDEIVARPIPLNFDAILALKQSPLALDLYTWLNYRVSYLRKPTRITWGQLQQQVGSDYADVKDFKKKAKGAIRKIKALWPELKITDGRGAFFLNPCSPQVPRTKLL